MSLPKPFRATLPALLLLGLAPVAQAFDWSSNEVQYLYGSQFREPFNPDDVAKHTITIQHADGHAYGRNFIFVDVLKSDGQDDHATEAYAEGYASVSLSKLTGRPWSLGIIKDLLLTAGINYGYKSYPDYGVNPRALLPGVTLDLNIPGFSFFSIDLLGYIDRGQFDGRDNGCHAETYQIAPAWGLPFNIGHAKFSFEGYANITGTHGNCLHNILAQPQLRWDVGNHFDKPDKFMIGVEYQYWHNKFGIEGLHESLPQFLAVWKY